MKHILPLIYIINYKMELFQQYENSESSQDKEEKKEEELPLLLGKRPQQEVKPVTSLLSEPIFKKRLKTGVGMTGDNTQKKQKKFIPQSLRNK